MAEGEFALVRQHLEQALPKAALPPGNAAPGSDHDLYAVLADTCAQQRDLDGLLKYAPLAEATAARCGHQLYLGIAHRAWGVAHRLAGDYAASEARLRQALEIFETLDTHWQLGRTWAEFGELATAQNQRQLAQRHYQNALQLFEALGAKPDAGRARAALEALA